MNARAKWREKNPGYHAAYKAQHPRQYESYLLKCRYGITLEEKEAMAVAQDGKCAICKKEKPLCIDHDHQTGRVRGLLCQPCNNALGKLGDNFEGVAKALEYLRPTQSGFSDVHWLQIEAPKE